MSNSMIVTQPQPLMISRESDKWGSGVCDCCDDVPECCFGFWCHWCFACAKTKRFGECLCLPLLDLCGIVPPITLSMRVLMRNRYGIKGTVCNDCLMATFCRACVWCQMSREMKDRSIQITLVGAKNL
ncbi:cornifelin homolog B [Misgurnus anguillicaudatus]|uniref:cornifelin homolog B n=1 Tax=Misgurnus anguillicaudatus TaxID=75329 RepID=UPI0024353949|nr:cornifelin homolog B [Misgurnus anguillicaudatus]